MLQLLAPDVLYTALIQITTHTTHIIKFFHARSIRKIENTVNLYVIVLVVLRTPEVSPIENASHRLIQWSLSKADSIVTNKNRSL